MTNEIAVGNASTGESVQRPMTEDELLADAENQKYFADLAAKRKEADLEKAAARKVILDKLGLTADDLKALGL